MKLHRLVAAAALVSLVSLAGLVGAGPASVLPASSASALPASPASAGDWPASIEGRAADRYPEGIAWDPTRQAFLVGSIATGRISVVGRDGVPHVLAQAPGVSTFGLHVDAVRNRFLVTYADIGSGERSSDATEYRQSGVGIYNLRTGRLERRIDLNTTRLNPAGGKHGANDLAIDARGNAYVTDPAADAIYKITPSGQASVLIRDDRLRSDTIGANGIVWDPAGYLLAVRYDIGRLFRISLHSRPRLTEVAIGTALVGGDGLALTRDRKLVAVTNKLGAAGNEAVTVLSSSDNYHSARVVTSVLWPVAGPTTGAVTPHGTYVLSGSLDVMLAGGQSDNFTIHRQ
ncbi:SMP-30/gluconolaconase/LRE-like protein [Kribbella antiqua]|uniref:SMP-30/gluconolaconase/LRE-like protein n=1 Tax=Kribbella antiqua TaxID=2512217 RepID=A0A4V2S3H4_9ACTN|nr:SMP-30/gluconolactonase/LRE family protein [Kribbella antiqua]TCO44470.1 SMP-30/gluconolaconase/LRE-like protein [Kribbella antiqua]